MKYYDGFLGQDSGNESVAFSGGDGEALFKQHLESQPDDWYYRTHPIVYDYNKRGHRCDNIEDINLDNYILFTGCSHTEGVGLEKETSYPYLLAQALECDYYNLALGATGIDVLEYNLLTWFARVKQKPKMVVVQWPDQSRFVSKYPGYETFIPSGSWSDDEHALRIIGNGEITGYSYARKLLSTNLIRTMTQGCTFISVDYSGLEQYDIRSISLVKTDVARDLAHSGMQSHQNLTNEILTFLNK